MYRPFEAFRPAGRLISVIGSGGKTTFLRYLSLRLPGKVILTTSTHIRPFPDLPLIDVSHCSRDQEADGAAGRPLKAHRPREPVIPSCSDLTVCLVGASGIGKPVSESCHCPDLFARLAGVSPDTPVREEHIAAVLNRENLADCFLVNQTDALPDPDQARRLCDLISRDAFPCALAPRQPAPARSPQCTGPCRRS